MVGAQAGGAGASAGAGAAAADYRSACASLGVRPVPSVSACLSSGASELLVDGVSAPLDKRDVAAVLSVLRQHRAVTDIEFPAGSLSADGAAELFAGLRDVSSVSSLAVDGSELGDSGAAAAASLLSSAGSIQLKRLQLRNNSITDRGVQALCDAIERGRAALQELDLQANGITSAGARALARVLPQSGVQWLSLRFNDVDDDGVAQLSTALRSGSSLRHLDLCGNRVGTPGAQALAAALPQSALRSLNVRSNVVGSLGIVALARSVTSSGLHELAVGSNALDADAVAAIGEMLRATASLVKLDMQGTKLGAAGAQAVRAGLKENTSLTHLYLDVDGGNADEVKPLLDALKSNTTLQVLEVGELGATSRELVKQITMTMRINRFLAGVTDDDAAGKPNGQVRDVGARRTLECLVLTEPSQDAPPRAASVATSTVTTSASSAAASSASLVGFGGAAASVPASAARVSPAAATISMTIPPTGTYARPPAGVAPSASRTSGPGTPNASVAFDERAGAASIEQHASELLNTWSQRLREEHVRVINEQERDFQALRTQQSEAFGKLMSDLKTFLRETQSSMQRVAADAEAERQAMRQALAEIKATAAAASNESAVRGIVQTELAVSQRKLRDEVDARLMQMEARVHADLDSDLAQLREQAAKLEGQITSLREDNVMAEENSIVAHAESEQALQRAVDALSADVGRLRIAVDTDVPARIDQVRRDMQHSLDEQLGALEKRLAGSAATASSAAAIGELEDELKRNHQLSLQALQVRANKQTEVLERRIGEVGDRLASLERIVKKEQEASLRALEAILSSESR